MTTNTELRMDRVVTSGKLGGALELENNCFVVGNDAECLVIDASWDAAPILEAVAGRRVVALVITHGHGDHVNAARALVDATGADALVHPADAAAYRAATGLEPDGELADGQVLTVAGEQLRVVHTPGHTPGSCCLDAPALGTLFSGDTLFPGGPGKTDGAEDFAMVLGSVERLFTELPGERTVWPGHGDPTTLAAETPKLAEWRERGW